MTLRGPIIAVMAFAMLSFGARFGTRGGCGPATAPIPQQTNTCAASRAPPSDGLAAVQLGRDVTGAFQPIVDGDRLPISFGPQGGQQVYVTVRLYSPTAASWAYLVEVRDSGGASVGTATTALDACAGWNLSQKVILSMRSSATTSGVLTVTATPEMGTGAKLTQSVNVSVAVP